MLLFRFHVMSDVIVFVVSLVQSLFRFQFSFSLVLPLLIFLGFFFFVSAIIQACFLFDHQLISPVSAFEFTAQTHRLLSHDIK